MLIGYARVSKADGSQTLDLQRDALRAAGVRPEQRYEDVASGMKDDRPGLLACLKALCERGVLVVWKLDRLGRNLRHLVNTVHELGGRRIGLKVLTGQGAALDTTTAQGRNGGRPYTMTAAKLRTAQAAMGQPETCVGALCRELGITRQTLYHHVGPKGELRPDGEKLLAARRRGPACGAS